MRRCDGVAVIRRLIANVLERAEALVGPRRNSFADAGAPAANEAVAAYEQFGSFREEFGE